MLSDGEVELRGRVSDREQSSVGLVDAFDASKHSIEVGRREIGARPCRGYFLQRGIG